MRVDAEYEFGLLHISCETDSLHIDVQRGDFRVEVRTAGSYPRHHSVTDPTHGFGVFIRIIGHFDLAEDILDVFDEMRDDDGVTLMPSKNPEHRVKHKAKLGKNLQPQGTCEEAAHALLMELMDALRWYTKSSVTVATGERRISYRGRIALLSWGRVLARGGAEGLQGRDAKETMANHFSSPLTTLPVATFENAAQLFRRGVPEAIQFFVEGAFDYTKPPRTALVIMVTATEWAVKEVVSHVEPSTAWFLRELASPPIHKIVKDYFVQSGLSTKEELDPSNLRNLQRAVETRNAIIHGNPKLGSGDLVADVIMKESRAFKASLEHIIEVAYTAMWSRQPGQGRIPE